MKRILVATLIGGLSGTLLGASLSLLWDYLFQAKGGSEMDWTPSSPSSFLLSTFLEHLRDKGFVAIFLGTCWGAMVGALVMSFQIFKEVLEAHFGQRGKK